MALLHILNGDSTLNLFRTQPIQGDVIVWREMLSEGPTTLDIDSTEFTEIRSDFFEKEIGISSKEYKENIIDEIDKIDDKEYHEVVLWFEYDLFCQINMVAVISWLYSRGFNNISLVCVGAFNHSSRLLGLGEIDPNLYPQLFVQRSRLDHEDILFASSVWSIYCSDDPRNLLKITENKTFIYLKKALDAHCKRYPFKNSGVNVIESELLTYIQKHECSRNDIIKHMMVYDNIYGVGDLNLMRYLQKLDPLISQWEPVVKTNSLQSNVFNILKNNDRWGGSGKYDYQWDSSELTLKPIKN